MGIARRRKSSGDIPTFRLTSTTPPHLAPPQSEKSTCSARGVVYRLVWYMVSRQSKADERLASVPSTDIIEIPPSAVGSARCLFDAYLRAR